MEIHRGNGADGAFVDQFLDAGGGGREAIIEGDIDPAAAFGLGCANPVNLFGGGGHRLFADDVCPAFQRADDDVVMRIVGRADDHQFRFLLQHHPVEIIVKRGARSHHGAGALGAHQVQVANADEFDIVAPAGQQFAAPHGGATIAGADQRIAFAFQPFRHCLSPGSINKQS